MQFRLFQSAAALYYAVGFPGNGSRQRCTPSVIGLKAVLRAFFIMRSESVQQKRQILSLQRIDKAPMRLKGVTANGRIQVLIDTVKVPVMG